MPKKIIVIDDSDMLRQQVCQVLREHGYEVVEAADGAEGAERIRATPEAALAICDINMPRMTGLEMLDALRAETDKLPLPILMLTTEGRPDLIERAKSAGAKGWIVKPFKPSLLVAAVAKIAGSSS